MDIKNVNNLLDKSLVEGQTVNSSKARGIEQSSQSVQDQQSQEFKKSLEKLEKKQLQDLFKEIKEKFDYMNKYLKIEIDKDLQEPGLIRWLGRFT